MTEKNVKVKVDPARADAGEEAFSPLVDILEQSDGTTVLVAELPGAASESIDIRVDKGVLSISADAEESPLDDSYARVYTGFVRGPYFRAFALSDEVDREQIDATFADGVLTLRLPRAEAARTRKIEIR
jgi:HSP20 family molecular chaperone IbpA